MQEELRDLRRRWGEREFLDDLLRTGCPTLYADPAQRELFATECRVGASPEVAYALNRAHYETDLSEVLPAIHVPTLVLHRPAPFDSEAEALAVAELIPHARAMRISHSDYFGIQLSLDIEDEIDVFVSGEAPQEIPTSVLTTVMFTDLVGSTEQASAVGDRRWRDLLSAHHAVVRRELARFRGEERDTAGDGFFATFDGPARAIRAAQGIIAGLAGIGLQARIGIHVGECEVHDGKPSGLAVNIGARVSALGGPGEVLVTRTVRDLVAGSGFEFEQRGSHALKGVPGLWDVFGVASGSSLEEGPGA
jgi:class 3 adenylate cyclase